MQLLLRGALEQGLNLFFADNISVSKMLIFSHFVTLALLAPVPLMKIQHLLNMNVREERKHSAGLFV